ncbi:MAG TPA: glycogen synthase GlgA [Lacipirellulaceae bacterium]|nr:glycogen synthase GlgA [Lacipirellulaceae bacterium]
MNILFATTEATPFAKTGGLGDVCGALPRELDKLGHNPVVIMPAFRQVRDAGMPIEPTGITVRAPIGLKQVEGHFLRSRLPGSDVPVFLLEQNDYYDRAHLYREDGEDYKDNCERFTFFCRAALEAVTLLELQTDLVHCHDWCTGLIPAYLKTLYAGKRAYKRLASVMTIHNLSYQGNFWHWDMALTGLDWKYFNWRQMEFYGNLSFLKTGIVFADMLTTVSPTYAREILSAPLGCGLEGALQHRRDDLVGIINGVDYDEWNPAVDKYLGPLRYSVDDATTGKAACKADLQRRVGLPERPEVPLLAAVGRLVDQKGFDLVARVMRQWAERVDVQWVVLGSGEPKYHQAMSALARDFPEKVAVRLEFSEELAHRIEAGADMFLMPSQYEPCGLNQLYSLKYGTVPIVRSTGGLADTVVDANEHTLAAGTATGFAFDDYTSIELAAVLERACRAYADPVVWTQLVQTGMRQDWSWRQSAEQYADLFEQALFRAPAEVS